MTKIIYWLYLINIFKLAISIVTTENSDTEFCPVEQCNCNSEKSLMTCNNNDTLAFRNKNLHAYKNLVIKNFYHVNRNSFENTLFVAQLDSISFNQIKLVEANSWSWSTTSTNVKYLQIALSDELIIEPNGFDYLKCDILRLTCVECKNNYAINMNAFGENTSISNLLLDYESINDRDRANSGNSNFIFKNQINLFNKLSVNDQPYDEYWPTWYTVAKIESISVNNVRGIFVLDYKFIPNFKSLNKIQITNTDINSISTTFSLLHSTNLKYLLIQRSKIEQISSNVFEQFSNLEYLDLSYNPIKMFEVQAFNGLTNLKSLNMEKIALPTFKSDDLCMLSYLPCKIDLNFDMDEVEENCASLYLTELKYRRLFSSRQINKCSNLNENLNLCYKSTYRNINDSCLSFSGDLILADVEFEKKSDRNNQTSSPANNINSSSNVHLSKFFNFKNKFNDSNINIAIKNNLISINKAEEDSQPKTPSSSTIIMANTSEKNTNSDLISSILSSKTKNFELDDTKSTQKSTIPIFSTKKIIDENKTTDADELISIVTSEEMIIEENENKIMSSSTKASSTNKSVWTTMILNDDEFIDNNPITKSTKSLTTSSKIYATDKNYLNKNSDKSKNISNRKDNQNTFDNSVMNSNNNSNELLYVIIIALVIFCMIQFLIGVFVFYLFFANKWKGIGTSSSNHFLSKSSVKEVGVADREEQVDSISSMIPITSILLNGPQSSSAIANVSMSGVKLGEGTSSNNIDTIYLDKNNPNNLINQDKKNGKSRNSIKNLTRPPIQFLRDTQSTLTLKWKSLIG